MSKFKMRLMLTGLEVEIEGTREDIPEIAQGVSQQLTGLLTPSARIAGGSIEDGDHAGNGSTAVHVVEPPVDGNPLDRLPRARRRRSPAARSPLSGADSSAPDVVDWRHDAARWGTPLQSWTTKKKALWLLYVVGQQTERHELSAPAIATTFNRYFRGAKSIRPQNVSRDLSLATVGVNALVAEDPTKTPSVWYLTDAGQRFGVALVAEALGRGIVAEHSVEQPSHHSPASGAEA